jgi:hypothetical protein
MKIPKSFNLFHHTFNVVFEKGLNPNHSEWGNVNYGKKEVKIDPEIAQDFQEQTFLHELTHSE